MSPGVFQSRSKRLRRERHVIIDEQQAFGLALLRPLPGHVARHVDVQEADADVFDFSRAEPASKVYGQAHHAVEESARDRLTVVGDRDHKFDGHFPDYLLVVDGQAWREARPRQSASRVSFPSICRPWTGNQNGRHSVRVNAMDRYRLR